MQTRIFPTLRFFLREIVEEQWGSKRAEHAVQHAQEPNNNTELQANTLEPWDPRSVLYDQSRGWWKITLNYLLQYLSLKWGSNVTYACTTHVECNIINREGKKKLHGNYWYLYYLSTVFHYGLSFVLCEFLSATISGSICLLIFHWKTNWICS